MRPLAPVAAIERRLRRRLAEVRTADHRIVADVRSIDRQALGSTDELVAQLWPEDPAMAATRTSLSAVRTDVEPFAGDDASDDGLTARRLADALSFALSMPDGVYFDVKNANPDLARGTRSIRILAVDRIAGRALGIGLSVVE